MSTGPKRILLAEDNAHDAELIVAALTQHHLQDDVLVARDGAEALDYLFRRETFAGVPAGHPAIVLLDIKMPRVDGLEVLRQVKRHPQLKTVPVVMLTSSREESDLARCYQELANGYVVKPVDYESLASAVREIGVFWALVNEPPPGTLSRSR